MRQGHKQGRAWTWLMLLACGLGGYGNAHAAQTGAAPDGEENRAAESADITAILKAMREADASALMQTYQQATDPIVHLWSAMALERVHFNLDAASADAEQCEQALFDNHPAIALACGQFRVGNLRLAGRVAEAIAAERALVQRYQDHHVPKQVEAMQAFLASQEDVPPLRYELPKGDATLPLKQGASVPTVTGQANGHEASFILDTGASDLILGEEDARRYGVKRLDKHGNTNGWISKGVPTQAGVLDTLQLGEITLHNVPVTIVPNPIHLIGGNLLAPLGTLRISSQAVQVYGADSTMPACDSPMLTSSALWGNGLRLLPRLDVNGQPQSVLLDTGASKYLLGTRAALDQATALHRRTSQLHDIGGNHALVHGDAAKVQITLAGQPFDMLFEVYTDATQNTHPITLGAGALRDMDFLLDYRHQHQCFLLHPNLR